MRRLLYFIIALLAVLLATEVGVTLLSQSGMERALRAQYELPPGLEADINSFPFLVSLARNHVKELQLVWEGRIPCRVDEGALEGIDYMGRVNLYDVELDMPSLLTGRLEIRSLSRLKAFIGLELDDLNEALGMRGRGFFAEDDVIFIVQDGEKTRCRVKVTDDGTLTIGPHPAYTQGSSSGSNPDEMVKTLDLESLPLDASLRNASITGEMVVLEISIPMWEGYLESLECYLKDKPSIYSSYMVSGKSIILR